MHFFFYFAIGICKDFCKQAKEQLLAACCLLLAVMRIIYLSFTMLLAIVRCVC